MTTTCKNAIASMRSCARRNLAQARAARSLGRPRMAAYHLSVALICRADANALQATATVAPARKTLGLRYSR